MVIYKELNFYNLKTFLFLEKTLADNPVPKYFAF
jgi:hypothetical protein